MEYKVSVIITTYNRSYNILKRAINSILNQTYKDFELIVVNDTPKEFPKYREVSEGISEFKGKLTYIASGVNKGACFVRNQGFKVSSGEYIAFLDDDDEWLPDKLEKQIKLFKLEDCVMVTCELERIYLDSNNIPKNKYSFRHIFKGLFKQKIKRITLDKLMKKNVVGGCSSPIISREAFIQSGGFNNNMPSAQDYDLWIRVAIIGKVYSVQEPLIKYFIHQSERISTNPQKKIYAYKYLIEQYKDLIENSKPFLKNKYIIIAYCYYTLSDYTKGHMYYRLAKEQNVITYTSIQYNFKIFKIKVKNMVENLL